MSTIDKIIHSCFYKLDIAVHKDDDILTVDVEYDLICHFFFQKML